MELKPYGEVYEQGHAPTMLAGQPWPGAGNTTGEPVMNHVLTGHERDYETGLDYMKARYYDPEVRIFLALDPMVLENTVSDRGFWSSTWSEYQ